MELGYRVSANITTLNSEMYDNTYYKIELMIFIIIRRRLCEQFYRQTIRPLIQLNIN